MTDDIKVPGGIVKGGSVVVGLVALVAGALVGMNTQFVSRVEWQRAEVQEAKEVQATTDALEKHIEQTRLDAVRLGTIEAQLGAIREDLSWFRRRMERDATPTRATK
jgi:hypothetical protein